VKIVVGLGNPGARYRNTPHNVGFATVDALAERLDCRLRRSLRFRAHVGAGRVADQDVLLVQPLTYMNNSGVAVGAVLRYRKLGPEALVVVMDDADLPCGKLRIRKQGGSGGHRGLQSVIDGVGSQAFVRVRLGIGRRESGAGLVEHVLSPFSAEERAAVEQTIDRAAQAVICVIECGADEAMNRSNA